MTMVSSEKRITANQINSRKSRGPRTVAGKARASRNALRHGLAAITHRDPSAFGEIERMAKAICDGDSNPLLFDQALIMAENERLLRCVRIESVAVVERLRDATAVPIAKGDNGLALAKARMRESELAWAECERIRAQCGVGSTVLVPPVDKLESLPPSPPWRPPTEERDEFEALCKALPDLERLARYTRRAWSRRKRAIRCFLLIKSGLAP